MDHEPPPSIDRDPVPPPPGMYRGGFRNSDRAVNISMDRFGIARPATLYYPGSSTDISLTGLNNVYTIHADQYLSEADIAGFQSLGADAHQVDAETWQPPNPVDMIAFINPSGIDVQKVIDASQLRDDGLVLWAALSSPSVLQSSENMQLEGVITFDDDGHETVDRVNLEDYFTPKGFSELTDDQVQDFNSRLDRYLGDNGLELITSREELYSDLQTEEYADVLYDMYYTIPNKKEGTFFVYKKNPSQTS